MAAQLLTQTIINEAVTLDEAKMHLRINPDDNSEDMLIILPLIAAAREYCENYTGRAFAPQKITALTDAAGTTELPRCPIKSIDSVTVDGKAVEYTADLRRGTVTVNEPNATITYTAGGHVPFMVRQAMLLLIGHWYANREAVTMSSTVAQVSHEVGMAAQAMLRQYKGWWF